MKKVIAIVFFILMAGLIQDAAAETYMVKIGTLNVRKEASSQSTIVAKLTRGQEVEVVAFSNDNLWAKVKVDNKPVGWVATEFIVPMNPSLEEKDGSKVVDEEENIPIGLKILRWLIYIGAGLGVVCFFLFIVKAAKRHKLFSHIIVFGGSTLVLIALATTPRAYSELIVMSPLMLLNVVVWPLLYIRNKGLAGIVVTIFDIGLFVVVMNAMNVGIETGFFRFVLTFLLIMVSTGIWICKIGGGWQLNSVCPYCGMYADHRLTGSEYVGSVHTTEDEVNERFDRSEISGNTRTDYYIREHNIKHYEHENYDDWYQCCKCGREFEIRRVEKVRVG